MLMMKRIISVLLVLTMLVGYFPAVTAGAEETENTEPTAVTEETVAAATVATVDETVAPVETVSEIAEEAVAPAETVSEPTEETLIPQENPDVIPVESVVISQAEGITELALGDTLQLTATVLPKNATDTTVVWSSSDETVAIVDKNGIVHAIADGQVIITAFLEEVEDVYSLTILKPVAESDISLDSILPQVAFSARAANETPNYTIGVATYAELISRLDMLKTKYLNEKYWTTTGAASDSSGSTSKWYNGKQCKGFAAYIFNDLFCGGYIGSTNGSDYYITSPNNAIEVGKISNFAQDDTATVKNFLSQGKPGDFIQVERRKSLRPHSMILVSIDANGVWLLDCNNLETCNVAYEYQEWWKFAEKNHAMSLYHSTKYPKDAPSPSYAAPTVAKLAINKENFKIGEEFTLTLSSDTTCNFYLSIIDADSGERIIGENATATYKNSFQRAGHYRAWMSAFNDKGSIDSNGVEFYVYGSPPTTATLSTSKSEINVGESITLSTSTNAYYTRIYASIFLDNESNKGVRVYEGNIPYSFSYTPTSAGIYSAYVSAYTHEGSVDSNWVTIYVGKFNVKYDANGGSGAPSSQTKVYGKSLTLSSSKPTRVGYAFQGWATSASATAASYQPGGSYKGNANATLYAVWKANTYTVTYNANGGSGAPSGQKKTHGVILTLSNTKPTRTGYTFQGWATSSGATSASYQPGGSYKGNANVTLYAVWKANTYAVTYNANGGSGSMSKSSHTYNSAKTLAKNSFTRTGYTFAGWATTASGTVSYGDQASVKNLTSTNGGNVTLYAQWVIKKITVRFNANDGSGGNVTQSFTYGNSGNRFGYNTDGTPKWSQTGQFGQWDRTGYTLLGWAHDSSANTAVYTPYCRVTDDWINTNYPSVNLYAVWKLNTYTINYNANGGSGAPSVQKKTHGVSLTLSSTKPTRTGYTFQGWATSASATSASYQPGGGYAGNANATLYAVWKANTYTVTYNANGGSGSMSKSSHTYNSAKTLTKNSFARTGYIFAGWATTASGTVSYGDQASVKNLISTNGGNVTLYAKWTIKKVTVRFNKNDGSGDIATQSFTYGAAGNRFGYNTDGTPKWTQTGQFGGWDRTGYTLLGWAHSASAETASYGTYRSVIDDWINTHYPSVDLFAVWKLNTYTISYNANGGSGTPSGQKKTHGVNLTLSSTKPSRTGYTFQGWATSASATAASYQPGGSYKGNADATLYAVWKVNTYTISYDANGGGNAPDNQTKVHDITLQLSGTKPIRSMYSFNGWATDKMATSAAYQAEDNYIDNASVIFYAVWEHVCVNGHSYENGVCKRCGTQEEYKLIDFYAANVIMGNNLDMMFALPKKAVSDWTGHYIQIERIYADGRAAHIQKIPYAQWDTNGSFYVVTYKGLAAKEMCDTITLTVYNADNRAVSNPWVDSMRGYAMRQLDKCTELQKTMFVDMLNYGAQAQTYFGYGTADLANSQLTAEQKAYASGEKTLVSTLNQGNKWKASNLILKSNIQFMVAFNGLTDDMSARVQFTGHKGNVVDRTVSGTEFGNNNGIRYVLIDDLVIADARQEITITIYNADGSIYTVCQESIQDYLARRSSVSSLFEAIMKFADSAYAYLHRND